MSDPTTRALDHYARPVDVAHVPNGASGDVAIDRVLQNDGIALRALDGETTEGNVGGARTELQNRAGGRHRDRLALQRRRRPKIKRPGIAVQVPLARCVQFLQGAAEVVSVSGPDRIRGVLGQPHLTRRAIH